MDQEFILHSKSNVLAVNMEPENPKNLYYLTVERKSVMIFPLLFNKERFLYFTTPTNPPPPRPPGQARQLGRMKADLSISQILK
jgi:hypothetical protein